MTLFDKAWEFIKPYEGKHNLNYIVEHEDGAIGMLPRMMCWQYIYERVGGVSRPEYIVFNPDDLNETMVNTYDRGGVASNSDILRVRFSLKPDESRQVDKVPYLRAVRSYLSIYQKALEPSSLRERWRDGVTLHVKHGGLTRLQLGTLLVGYRNLGEKNRYPFFNRLIEAGLSPSLAAFWVNIFEPTNMGLKWAGTYHTIFSEYPAYANIDRVKAFSLNNPMFYVDKDQVVEPITGAIEWNFRDELQPLFTSGTKVLDYFKPATHTCKDDWGTEIPYLNTEATINLIKALYE